MRSAAGRLLEAHNRPAANAGEDRLTELLAAALAMHQGFARAFVTEVFDDGDPEKLSEMSFEVRTQVLTGPGARVDVEICGRQGERVVRVWSENKRLSGRRHGQLEKYLQHLPTHNGEGRLVTIVAFPQDAQACLSPKWATLRWQHVAELADTAGRASASRSR